MKRTVFRHVGHWLYHLVWVLINVPFFAAANVAFLFVLVNTPVVVLVEWILALGPNDTKFPYARDAKIMCIIFFEYVEYIARFLRYVLFGWNEYDDESYEFDPFTEPVKVARRIRRYQI